MLLVLRYLPLLALLGIALEIASVIWVGGRLGVLRTLLLLFLGTVIGASLFRSAGASMAQLLRPPVNGQRAGSLLASAALARVIAGVLFFIPGFFSDALALLVLLPPVQSWVASRIRVSDVGAGTYGKSRGRSNVVIEGEAVEIVENVEILPPPRPRRD